MLTVNPMRRFLLREYAQLIVKPQVNMDRLIEMEKTTGNSCPRCGLETLNIYYDDGADLQLGAVCDSCGLRGVFTNDKLVPLLLA